MHIPVSIYVCVHFIFTGIWKQIQKGQHLWVEGKYGRNAGNPRDKFLLCPLLSLSLPFREREHPRFADACGQRNDESQRVNESSQIHTWHGK